MCWDCPARSDPEEFREVLLTNVIGSFMVITALLPLIKKSTKKQVRAKYVC
jgi:NAD(P)-dependent dehydrogenase (short-subunit alcohol dehydrogenase family)